MRLPPIPPADLTPEQKPFYDEMTAGIAAKLHGFVSQRADGALVGPFNPMLHFQQWGKPVWDVIMAMLEQSTLPKQVREIAILVVGARFASRYELYAHEHVAAVTGLSPEKTATIVAGERPSDMTRDEALAYDLASSLVRYGPLPEAIYQAGVNAYGEQGVAELTYLVGTYAMVSVILNSYDISVPGREEGLG